MSRLSHKTLLYGLAGALGGTAAWVFILYVSGEIDNGLLTEMALGALAGIFIGGFIWSHEALSGRQFTKAIKQAAYGAMAGLLGGLAGAGLGNSVFSVLGKYAADIGGVKASLGMALSVSLGWAVLGSVIGMSGGIMIRSRDRTLYGLLGGCAGGFVGGLMFNALPATSIWSVLIGLLLLGMSIGAFISLVEEAFVSAKMKVIKGRHLNREFPLLKDLNLVGRDDRSDVCLSGAEGVSIRHALIKRDNGHYMIEADQEGKAVYVNQKMTRSSRLSDGDVIRVGSVLLMFSAVRKAAAAASFIMLCLLTGITSISAQEKLQAQITQFDLSGFPEVKTFVSILDKNNKPVHGLAAANVSLRENDTPVEIKEMRMAGTQGKREALSVSLVLDRSESMQGNKMKQAKESVLRFISLMEQEDKASLLVFNDEVTQLAALGDVPESLKKALQRVQPEGHTALFDAIANGVDSIKEATGRRAVIVLTDGKANRGSLSIDQAIDFSTKANVSVYVIGLGEDVRTARLERIAQETGGTYFFTPSAEGLAAIYETISQRIRNEYVITYDTQKRGEYLRKVSLSLKEGPSAERMYFQPQSSLFGSGAAVPLWAFLAPFLSMAALAAVSYRRVESRFAAGHLSLVRGRGTKKELDINSTVTLGRDERNTIGLFKDEGIEQQHAEVLLEDGNYVIEDKSSTAGTYVNKKKVTGRQALQDGDVIEMGHSTIVFSAGSAQSCAGCGSPVRANAKFCPTCGVKAA